MNDFFETFYKTDCGRRVLASLRQSAYGYGEAEEDYAKLDPLVKLALIQQYESIRLSAGIEPEDEFWVITAEAQIAIQNDSEEPEEKPIIDEIT